MNLLALSVAAAIGQTCPKACTGQNHVVIATVSHTVAAAPAALPNIVETAVGAGKFKTLVAALLAADLAEPLRSANAKFTVFAPTDEAFAKLDPALVASLLKPENKAKLAAILKYHVLHGERASGALANAKYRTLGGANVSVAKGGHGVTVNGARVTAANIHAANGVIHVIDSVLLPPSDTPAGGKDLIAVAQQAGSFNILLKALEATKLDDALRNGDAKFTVFAPTDAAFRKLGDAKIRELLAQPETLANILKFHVVAGAAVGAKDFVKAGSAKTLQGGEVVADLKDGRLTVNGVKVSATDVKASNGVVHVIDAVLIP